MGYWFPNPKRPQRKSESETGTTCCPCLTRSDKHKKLASSSGEEDEEFADNDNDDSEGEDELNEVIEDGSSIRGLSSSVKDNIARIESQFDGKPPYANGAGAAKGSDTPVITAMTSSDAASHIG